MCKCHISYQSLREAQRKNPGFPDIDSGYSRLEPLEIAPLARESSGAWALRVKITGARGLRVTVPEAHTLRVFLLWGPDPCVDFFRWLRTYVCFSGAPNLTSDFSGNSGLTHKFSGDSGLTRYFSGDLGLKRSFFSGDSGLTRDFLLEARA